MKILRHTKVVVAIAVVALQAGAGVPWSNAQTGPGGNACGQPVSTGSSSTATDALFVLRAAVGAASCDLCICDVDGNGLVSATDALQTLKISVGQSLPLACPACPTTTTTTTTSATSTTSHTTTTTLDPGTQPSLTTGDFPQVSPCSDRDTLPNDASFLSILVNAAEYDNLVNFSEFTTNGFSEICGLSAADNVLANGNISWDPSADNALSVCNPITENVSDFFTLTPLGHGPDLCQEGNDGFTLAMPRAGIYRRDGCVEANGNAYDVRARLTVSGPSVDQTFSTLGIVREDLKACNGSQEIATRQEGRAFVSLSPRRFQFSIRSGPCNGGTDHVDVITEFICIKKRATPCPPAAFDCF